MNVDRSSEQKRRELKQLLHRQHEALRLPRRVKWYECEKCGGPKGNCSCGN